MILKIGLALTVAIVIVTTGMLGKHFEAGLKDLKIVSES
jgi:hypothetical protein